MTGDLFINGKDAYEEWGVSLEAGAVAELLTAPEVKDYIQNDCPSEDGVRMSLFEVPKYKERDVQLTISITAKGETDYLSKYKKFVDVLKGSLVTLQLGYDPDVTYRLKYKKMSNFSQLRYKIAKFVVNFIEPDPTNRQTL